MVAAVLTLAKYRLQANPGQVAGLVQSSLSPDLQQRLQQYCQSAGVSIV